MHTRTVTVVGHQDVVDLRIQRGSSPTAEKTLGGPVDCQRYTRTAALGVGDPQWSGRPPKGFA